MSAQSLHGQPKNHRNKKGFNKSQSDLKQNGFGPGPSSPYLMGNGRSKQKLSNKNMLDPSEISQAYGGLMQEFNSFGQQGSNNSFFEDYDVDDEIQADEAQATWEESKYEYKKLYNALKDLEKFNVKISVPEFVFIGFQSSGKTSAVSQAAKLAVGVMKHGTASRCPTRFRLINNPALDKPIIKVNGELCSDDADLTNKTLEIAKKYEDQGIFTKDVIEVRIESPQVPELTFVDLPGLIKGDNEKFKKDRKQLDEITAHFLHQQNPDGTWRYIPILVREPRDIELDTHDEKKYIDDLVKQYANGSKRRSDWVQDTLHIVNKFDTQLHRAPCSNLVAYMKYCCDYGETILTMLNPRHANCATMSNSELNDFVASVSRDEQGLWNKVINEFRRKDDEHLHELMELKQNLCGVVKMNEVLAKKMCEIVKRVIPSIEAQLEQALRDKQAEIARIVKKMEMCNPYKLKTECIEFGNLFEKYLREFYNGSLIPTITFYNEEIKNLWTEEVNAFHSKNVRRCIEWNYEIPPTLLQSLLKEKGDRPKPAGLLTLLNMKLTGSAAINRIIDAWITMVSYMSFPDYSDEDIVNICGAFGATRQPDLWISIRNVVLDAIKHLEKAAEFLGEFIRYRLKRNADIIFEYTLEEKYRTPQMKQLLKRTLRDYKLEIDNIIDEFVSVSKIVPRHQAEILDKDSCEETINIGRLINKMLYYKKLPENRPRKESNPPPPPPRQRQKDNVRGIDEEDIKSDHEDDESPKPLNRDDEEVQPEIENIDEYVGRYTTRHHDKQFYEAMHGQDLNYPLSFGSASYDIALIKHLSLVHWTNIKQFTTRDIVDKLTNRVMAHITEHGNRMANAIQCGVDRRRIQELVMKLVHLTGVDGLELEKILYDEKKATIKIEKSINDLGSQELEQIYGESRDELEKERKTKVRDLNKYRRSMEKVQRRIRYINNGSFDEIDDDMDDENEEKEFEEEEEEDDNSEDPVDSNLSSQQNIQINSNSRGSGNY